MREINMIPSKSDAHRALICAALSALTGGGRCKVICSASSADIQATERCLNALQEGRREMYCGESGSTLRFLLPVMGALGCEADFYPEGRLPQRPLSPLYEELSAHGCRLSPAGSIPFSIKGKLEPGVYRLPGNVSSQYISGLLFALPLLSGDSDIIITGRLESEAYVNMTLKVLQDFGVRTVRTREGYHVPGGQQYNGPTEYQVEGDWSNGCFWLAAGAFLQEGLRIKGLAMDSLQGDKEIIPLLRKFGAKVEIDPLGINVSRGRLEGIHIDGAQIPDMVPILAVLGCGAMGDTVITNAGRLRIKESDRLASVTQVLCSLGAEIEELSDGLIIHGKGRLRGGRVDSWGDHRIAMMAAIASLLCEEKVTIDRSAAVNKSYPTFFSVMEEAGLDGNVERN